MILYPNDKSEKKYIYKNKESYPFPHLHIIDKILWYFNPMIEIWIVNKKGGDKGNKDGNKIWLSYFH